MSTTIHLNLDSQMFVHGRAPRWMSALARLDGFQLDRELATGEDPHSGPLLAARAEQICRFKERKLLGRRLFEVVTGKGRLGTGSGVRPSRSAVGAARWDLLALAEELERPGPANPQGVAQARLLLTDSSGPLYPPDRIRMLTVRVRRACEQVASFPPPGRCDQSATGSVVDRLGRRRHR
jgi:hypothetical protein